MAASPMERTSNRCLTRSPPNRIHWESPIIDTVEEIDLTGPDQLFPLVIQGTGLHLGGFNGMYLEYPPLVEWHLVYRYYARTPVTGTIDLYQSTRVFHGYRPIVHFIMENKLVPDALLEVTYYRLVQLYPLNPQYYLQRTNRQGDQITLDAGMRLTSFYTCSPTLNPDDHDSPDSVMEDMDDDFHDLSLLDGDLSSHDDDTLVNNNSSSNT
jgi:hypothetical protein